MESQKPTNLSQGYVRLDVGGNFYTTSLSTLARYPNSMLYSMFTQENIPLAQDKEGRYIIDRDGSVFRYILNFLRGGNLNLPPGFTDYDQLQEEVDFYQLDEMKELLRIWKVAGLMETNPKANEHARRVSSRSSLVKLNVGGEQFHLVKTTSGGSTLEQKLQSMVRKASGAFASGKLFRNIQDGTVDCDPISFQYIINFLTKIGSYRPKNQIELENLKNAVYHYDIDDMKSLVDQQVYDVSNRYYLMLQS